MTAISTALLTRQTESRLPEGDSSAAPAQAVNRGIAGSSFATMLNEKRLKIRAQLNHQRNVSPQRMFEGSEAQDNKARTASDRSDARNADARVNRDSQELPAFERSLTNRSQHQAATNSFKNSDFTAKATDLDNTQIDEFDSLKENNQRGHTASNGTSPQSGKENKQVDANVSSSSSAHGDPTGAQLKTQGDGSSGVAVSEISVASSNSQQGGVAEKLGQWIKAQAREQLLAGAERVLPVTTFRISSESARAQSATSLTEQVPAHLELDDTSEAEASSREIFNQLVRSMRVRHDAHSSSAQMELDPPRLGKMRVDVHMEGDRLRVDVHASSQEAKELLSSNLASLKSALVHQGIQLNEINVLVSKTHAATGEWNVETGRLTGDQNTSRRSSQQDAAKSRNDTRQDRKAGREYSHDSQYLASETI